MAYRRDLRDLFDYAVDLSAGLKLRFSVPFAFTSGNTVFPAGEYEVTQADRYLLRLRNVETQA